MCARIVLPIPPMLTATCRESIFAIQNCRAAPVDVGTLSKGTAASAPCLDANVALKLQAICQNAAIHQKQRRIACELTAPKTASAYADGSES